jgi:hypothetical protein
VTNGREIAWSQLAGAGSNEIRSFMPVAAANCSSGVSTASPERFLAARSPLCRVHADSELLLREADIIARLDHRRGERKLILQASRSRLYLRPQGAAATRDLAIRRRATEGASDRVELRRARPRHPTQRLDQEQSHPARLLGTWHSPG